MDSVLLNLLAEDRRAITYRPLFARMVGSVTSAILLQQIVYWWGPKQKPFYKFRGTGDPSKSIKHKLYTPGDSWLEELSFSPAEFDGALRRIASKITQGTSKFEALAVTDPSWDAAGRLTNAHHLVIFWTDADRVTWYQLNTTLLTNAIKQKYMGIPQNQEFLGNTENRNYLGNKQSEITQKIPETTATQEKAKNANSLITETNPKTTAKTNADSDVVVALMQLGLLKRQAIEAVRMHGLVLSEVDQWRAWLDGLDAVSNPTAVLASAIRAQRLPPPHRKRKGGADSDDNGRQRHPGLYPVGDALAADGVKYVQVQNVNGLTSELPLGQVWQMVITDLQHKLPRDEWETWIAPTLLLDVENERAVMGAPNIFIRQEIEGRYLGTLAAGLGAVLGKVVEMQAVTGMGVAPG